MSTQAASQKPEPDAQHLATQLAGELADGKVTVPMLPDVASEVLSSSLDDRTNAQRLATLIERDQGLATHILRVVNSPAFRGSAEIVSLKQAIARLGMDRIREIALTISLKSTLYKPGRFDTIVQSAWQTALTAALWAKEISRFARKNVETSYLCALLHNVGVPIVVSRSAELRPDIELEMVQGLARQLNAAATAVLVKEWQLPNEVALAASFLGDGDIPVEHESERSGLMIVAAALNLAEHMLAGELVVEDLLQHQAFQYLNFYPDDLADLLLQAPMIQATIQEV